MIDLVTVINELRTQLEQARVAAQESDVQFALGPIELEATVGVTSETGAGAKVRFYVIEGGGDFKDSAVTTHKIKLTLTPELRTTSTSGNTTEEALSRALIYVTGSEIRGER